MPLKNFAEEFEREAHVSLINWLLEDAPTKHATVVVDADTTVADVDTWATFLLDAEGREQFVLMDYVPVEVGRIPDPMDPSKVLVHWVVIELCNQQFTHDEAA